MTPGKRSGPFSFGAVSEAGSVQDNVSLGRNLSGHGVTSPTAARLDPVEEACGPSSQNRQLVRHESENVFSDVDDDAVEPMASL